MTQIVVDTDVVSFPFKNHAIGRQYDPEHAGRIAPISFMTVAEVERWAIQYRWGEHRLHWLHLYPKRFTVAPSSPNLCRKWAEAMAAAQVAEGVPTPPVAARSGDATQRAAGKMVETGRRGVAARADRRGPISRPDVHFDAD